MLYPIYRILLCVVLAAVFLSGNAARAQDAAEKLAGPDAAVNRLADDAEDKSDLLNIDEQAGFGTWKAALKERTGLDFGFDYNLFGFAATESLGDDGAAAGAFRIFGNWELFKRGTPNNGSLVFKIENRHAFTGIEPSAFGGEIGYVGRPNVVFSDQGWRATHAFWQQRFAGGRGVSYLGFLDVTDYVDFFELASPWTGFSHFSFQNGSGTIGGLPDGALGAMVGGFLNDNLYAVAGIADANGDPANLSSGFDTFFDEFETFKSFEVGWAESKERLFVNNAHVTIWQVDERRNAGTPDGWGLNISLVASLGDTWMPFLRGGWAEAGGSPFQTSISTGLGYTRDPGRSMLGLGVNWSRPNKTTFSAGLSDQYAVELFQRVQLTEGIEITPSVQFIIDPALNPVDDAAFLFGLRLRAAF